MSWQKLCLVSADLPQVWDVGAHMLALTAAKPGWSSCPKGIEQCQLIVGKLVMQAYELFGHLHTHQVAAFRMKAPVSLRSLREQHMHGLLGCAAACVCPFTVVLAVPVGVSRPRSAC